MKKRVQRMSSAMNVGFLSRGLKKQVPRLLLEYPVTYLRAYLPTHLSS